jgi:phage shock protein PspC (stress-responsive transcriptional regulator)
MSTMSEDIPPQGGAGGSKPEARRMPRARVSRLLAGVCGGLGRYTRIDPVVFRVGFAVLVLADGWGILLYVLAALLMPPDEYRLAPIERLVRRRLDGDAVLALLGLLMGAGVLLNLMSLAGNHLSGPLTTVAILALIVLVVQSRGVSLPQFVRTLPDRVQGHPATETDMRAQAQPVGRPVTALPPGAVDLAALNPMDTPPEGTYDLRDDIPASAAYVPYRRHSVLGKVTFFLAIALGAAMIPVVSGRSQSTVVTTTVATALVVVALGLILSAWYGRSHGMVFVGTLLSLTLVATALDGGNLAGGKLGDVTWRPVDPAQSRQTYKLIAGNGRLDLTALPLHPGQVVTVHVEFGAAAIKVTVPRDAWVDLDASIGLGDVTVDHKIHSGPRAKISRALPPDAPTARSPRIELRIHGRLGDLEVSHV